MTDKKFACPLCASEGKQVLFRTQTEFGKHLLKVHRRFDIISESQKGVKPHLLIVQEIVDKKKKKEQK